MDGATKTDLSSLLQNRLLHDTLPAYLDNLIPATVGFTAQTKLGAALHLQKPARNQIINFRLCPVTGVSFRSGRCTLASSDEPNPVPHCTGLPGQPCRNEHGDALRRASWRPARKRALPDAVADCGFEQCRSESNVRLALAPHK